MMNIGTDLFKQCTTSRFIFQNPMLFQDPSVVLSHRRLFHPKLLRPLRLSSFWSDLLWRVGQSVDCDEYVLLQQYSASSGSRRGTLGRAESVVNVVPEPPLGQQRRHEARKDRT